MDWHPPEVGAGRFGEWLENNVDWALSRDRYWGTPLPVWVCNRDETHVEVIGSFARLAERSGRPLAADFDPHKPFIDEFTWSCECGGTKRRTPEVIDAWFDSGSMPSAQWHYPFEGEARILQPFPGRFHLRGLGSDARLVLFAAGDRDGGVRQSGLSARHRERAGARRTGPEDVEDAGQRGRPWEVIGRFGADTIRLYLLASSQVWLPKRFDQEAIGEVSRGFVNQLRNTYKFFADYAEEWTPAQSPPPAERPLVDRWLLSRLDATIAEVHAAWSGYDPTLGVRTLMAFVDELSNWYVRVNRPRFWAVDIAADPAALATLHEALVAVSRLLAPAAPFLSDWLHRALAGTSVHLARFPESVGRRDEALEAAMEAVRRLASLARAAREERGLRVRQPLARMQVAVPPAARGAALEQLLELLRLEVNVKGVDVVAVGRRSGEASRPAELPLPGQALRQADAGDCGGRRCA